MSPISKMGHYRVENGCCRLCTKMRRAKCEKWALFHVAHSRKMISEMLYPKTTQALQAVLQTTKIMLRLA